MYHKVDLHKRFETAREHIYKKKIYHNRNTNSDEKKNNNNNKQQICVSEIESLWTKIQSNVKRNYMCVIIDTVVLRVLHAV